MNASTQMDGETIAKAVVARSKALDTLFNEKQGVFSWQYVGLTVLGGAWGWVVFLAGQKATLLVSIAAGSGFFLAAAAFLECVRLKRRLDAVLVLVRHQL